MSHVGKDTPSASGTDPSDARPGGPASAEWRGLIVPSDPEAASSVHPTPFGLIRIWQFEGQTLLAETSPDGTVLGPALVLGEGEAGARAASAVVHRIDADFFLTVAWLSGGKPGDPGNLVMNTWQIGRGALGLSLSAANDNPILIGAAAAEPLVTGLPGDDLLLTWVDAIRGTVHGEVRAAHGNAASTSLPMGSTTTEALGSSRRVQVIEVAPLEYALLWLAANRRELAGLTLTCDVALVEDGNGTWSSRSLPPVALTAEAAGGFTLTRGDAAGTFEVIYEAAKTAGVVAPIRQDIALFPSGKTAGALASEHLAASDFGFMWASQDLLHLAPSALHPPGAPPPQSGPLLTRGDEPVLIDLAAHGAGQGVKVVAADGVPLSYDGPTRIHNGWLQARFDGHLTFTPDVDSVGHIRLVLSGISETGAAWLRHVDIYVEGLFDTAEVELRNPVKAIPAHAVIAHHAQMAEIGIRGEAPPHGAVSLSGVDADKFLVIGNGLFLRAGTKLEPTRKALDVAVQFKDGLAGAAIAASLTIAVMNEPGTFLSLALTGRAQAAEVTAGQVVAALDAVDQAQGGDRITLALLSNAGGRFALSGGNLVVASPQLFTGDPEATYDIVVRLSQPNGVAVDHKVTLHHEDVLGRLPPAPENAPAAPADERSAVPLHAHGHEAEIEAHAAPVIVHATDSSSGEHTAAAQAEIHHDAASVDALPPLRVEADAPAPKGASSQPDLGANAGSSRPAESDGLTKVLAQQQDTPSVGDQPRHETRGSDSGSGREHNRADTYEADLVEALYNLTRSNYDRGDHRDRDRGAEHKDEKSGQHKTHAEVDGDTLFFKPGFGKETIEHVKLSGGEAHDVLDLSLYGTTFEALRAAGAFEQVGNDVILTLNPADPAHSDQIILKSIDLHQIDPGDFKFS